MRSQLLDSPFELGLRAMMILLHEYPKPMSCDRILFYDYYATYNLDIVPSDKAVVVFPPYPYRNAEMYNKRDRMRKGLLYYAAKDLISVHCDSNGISYAASVNTQWMGDSFANNKFAKQYQAALKQCSPILNGMSEQEILLDSKSKMRNCDVPELHLHYEGGEEQ